MSRNGALQNLITRLGARINDLKQENWNIEGNFRKTDKGKDYVYTLISAPEKPKIVIRDGVAYMN